MKRKAIEFLEAKRRDEARATWQAALRLGPLDSERVPAGEALGRVLAEDLVAPLDVPPFDRSVVDGYAVIASDTFGATETRPARLRRHPSSILAGSQPSLELEGGSGVEIATGGVLPRGANAVQMVERIDTDADTLLVYKPVVPGANIQGAGSDLRLGDVVLTRSTRLGSRELGVVAALGLAEVAVVRRPRVAVLSTGDELVSPGGALRPGLIHDTNSRLVCDAVSENGGVATFLGIVPDDEERLEEALRRARDYDLVVLSGGTSKGTGDLSFRLLDRLGTPGVLVHGVQIKPGKPVVLAAWSGKPVVVLPGFPTSAILTFNLFVRPVLRGLAGLEPEPRTQWLEARVPDRVHSAAGRYEYVLVHLVRAPDGGLVAYPIPKSSGSVSAFAEADGYLEVPESRDFLEGGETARVTLLGSSFEPADLVFIGSHCQGMDLAFSLLRAEQGLRIRVLNVGSQGGVGAARRGEADLAGVHLLDASGGYNRGAWQESGGQTLLVRGYARRQGIVYRPRDFAAPPRLEDLIRDPARRMINRPRGSGTRVLFDRLLARACREGGLEAARVTGRLAGYDSEARSHHAVGAAVSSGRADWGIAIEAAALPHGLGFVALQDEEYDLLIARARLESRPVRLFRELLRSARFQERLGRLGGYRADSRTGEILAG